MTVRCSWEGSDSVVLSYYLNSLAIKYRSLMHAIIAIIVISISHTFPLATWSVIAMRTESNKNKESNGLRTLRLTFERLLTLKQLGLFLKCIISFLTVFIVDVIFLHGVSPIHWIISQHCGDWWPGALAPGYQHQCVSSSLWVNLIRILWNMINETLWLVRSQWGGCWCPGAYFGSRSSATIIHRGDQNWISMAEIVLLEVFSLLGKYTKYCFTSGILSYFRTFPLYLKNIYFSTVIGFLLLLLFHGY